jgi:CRP-like cAMP-binding protein
MIAASKDVGLLKYLSHSDLELIVAKAIKIEKKPGDAIALSGEPVAGICWIKSGQVGVYPPGATSPFAHLERGAAFGEMSFLDGSKASATIRIEKAGTEILMIGHSVLHQLIKDSPSIGNGIYRGIAESLAQKLRLTNIKIAAEISATRQSIANSPSTSGVDSVSEFITAIERTIQF